MRGVAWWSQGLAREECWRSSPSHLSVELLLQGGSGDHHHHHHHHDLPQARNGSNPDWCWMISQDLVACGTLCYDLLRQHYYTKDTLLYTTLHILYVECRCYYSVTLTIHPLLSRFTRFLRLGVYFPVVGGVCWGLGGGGGSSP